MQIEHPSTIGTHAGRKPKEAYAYTLEFGQRNEELIKELKKIYIYIKNGSGYEIRGRSPPYIIHIICIENISTCEPGECCPVLSSLVSSDISTPICNRV